MLFYTERVPAVAHDTVSYRKGSRRCIWYCFVPKGSLRCIWYCFIPTLHRLLTTTLFYFLLNIYLVIVSRAMRETTYPFIAVVCLRDNRMTVVWRIEGNIFFLSAISFVFNDW